jgi:hypothetical protein
LTCIVTCKDDQESRYLDVKARAGAALVRGRSIELAD